MMNGIAMILGDQRKEESARRSPLPVYSASHVPIWLGLARARPNLQPLQSKDRHAGFEVPFCLALNEIAYWKRTPTE